VASVKVYDELYADGAWRTASSAQTVEVISPSTESVVGRVPDADERDVGVAVAAARKAFDEGPWPRLPMAERADLLMRAATALRDDLDEIARTVTTEMGAPISASLVASPGALTRAEFFIETARAEPLWDVRHGSRTAVVFREPVGVVGAIGSSNGPFSMALLKLIPSLVVGCTVVYKPAAETPLDIYLIARAFDSAGLPPGVFNFVTGGRDTGRHLVQHPGLDKVSFTGSTAAGREIGRACGELIRPVQLELGGKSAAIVLHDADIDAVLAAMAVGGFANSGQMCAAFSRVLVSRNRYKEVVDGLCDVARSFRVGDPFDPTMTMGPVVSERQWKRVQGYVAAGVAQGARLLVGGRRPADLERGWYLEPTVFGEADNTMRISREEIFGPVVTVIAFDTVEDAVRIANDSEFGLHGGVFTADDDAALSIARSIRTGTFSVNDWVYNIEAPFGGVKNSGIGRDTGREALLSYLAQKTVNIPAAMVERFV
jgi:aldehyde dehydrogenase (NAD+)